MKSVGKFKKRAYSVSCLPSLKNFKKKISALRKLYENCSPKNEGNSEKVLYSEYLRGSDKLIKNDTSNIVVNILLQAKMATLSTLGF